MRGISTNASSLPPIRTFSSTKTNGATSTTFQSPISPGLPSFSTIPVRTSTPANDSEPIMTESSAGMGSDGVPPDLNQELAALSDKLIKAINHTALLDDSLQSTKHELELSKARIKQLEAIAKKHDEMMAKGLLVEKKDVEIEQEQFMRRLREERTQRSKVEKEKKSMEQELEHLTTALFEEANKMVTASRKEKDAMDRKNEQLRAQLHDTELLLASHQEQLAELKVVLQQMTAEREESELHISNMSTPTTPGLGNRSSKESLGRVFEAISLSSSNQNADEACPTNPLSLPHLVQPVFRYDTGSYQEFCSMLRAPKNSPPVISPGGGRLSGGSLTSLQVMGMGIGISSISSPHHSPTAASNPASTPSTPVQSPAIHSPSLKETKFYKRVLVEDIEPTLRLDAAPGLSWLAKRSVFTAINDGSLVIEPIPVSSKLHLMACCLCGESRNDELHVRTHKMRTSETDTTQKYSLCTYCVGRLRATCDFLAFLRAIKDGLWKYETEDDQKHAWEEAVKLRDRMFWSRIGGGVVPVAIQYTHKAESQRNSVDQQHVSEPSNSNQEQIRTPPPSSPPRTPRTPELSVGKEATVIAHKDEGQKKAPSYLTPIKKLSFGKFGFLDNHKVAPSPILDAKTTPNNEQRSVVVRARSGQEHETLENVTDQANQPGNVEQATTELVTAEAEVSAMSTNSPLLDTVSSLPSAVEVSDSIDASERPREAEKDHDRNAHSISDQTPSSPTIPGSFW